MKIDGFLKNRLNQASDFQGKKDMNIIFQRDLGEKERLEYENLVSDSIKYLPYTFAFPINNVFQSIAKKEYGKGMNYALDFFEISILWLSSYLLKKLISNKNKLSRHSVDKLREVIRFIDLKRPMSFGDSINAIFLPLLNVAKADLDNDLVSSLFNHLMKKNQCVLLGDKKEPGVVHIRNEYKAHSTTLSENLYKGLLYTLEPNVIILLKALLPLQQMKVFSLSDNKTLSHQGLNASLIDLDKADCIDSHYYLNDTEELLDLFPLIFCNKGEKVYVFHTLKGESISYVSANEEAVNITTSDLNDDFDKVFQEILPGFDIAKQLNSDEIKEKANKESRKFLDRIYREKRYNKELFVDRKVLSDKLNEFIHNLNHQFLPILGEAGQGKTNQLGFWVESFIEDGKSVLIFQSSDFISISLEEKIREVFGLKKRNIERILDEIHSELKNKNEVLYIFFDAINECVTYPNEENQPGPLALFSKIGELLLSKPYSQFKIIATCRNFTWKNFLKKESEKYISKIKDEEGGFVQLYEFTTPELREAYNLYSELFQMATAFEDLQPSAKIRLKDPLILKICSTNYLGKELPEDIASYTSLAIFEKMLQDIESSYAGKKQKEILDKIGEYFLFKYESGEPIDSIDESLLTQDEISDPILRSLSAKVFNKKGMTIAYGELINKPERPILRISQSSKTAHRMVQFIYERFLEFILARIFLNRELSKLDKKQPIPESVYLSYIRIAEENEVYMSTLRNVMALDILRTHDYSSLISLVENHHNDSAVMELVNEVCNIMVKENYEKDLFRLLTNIFKKESDEDKISIKEYNIALDKIESNKADSEVIENYKSLSKKLENLIVLRKLATVNILNGIFLTDYFNENLYRIDPYNLLWILLGDSIREIKNDACMYIYYLSNRKSTITGSPVKELVPYQIINRMISEMKSKHLLKVLSRQDQRTQLIENVETAVRLTFLLIIDKTLTSQRGEERDNEIGELLGYIREVFNYFTLKGRLVKLLLPLLKIVLRKQITFQSDYVNNAIEYQGFWNEEVVPAKQSSRWDRDKMNKILPFLNYNTETDSYRHSLLLELDEIMDSYKKAYETGDSFSYFVLERVLVIIGINHWQKVKATVQHILKENLKDNEWLDYSQMSLLYILYQISLFTDDPVVVKEILQIYTDLAKDWTIRTKGLYKARFSHKANAKGLYKRNVMTWYTAVYKSAESVGALADETQPVPAFHELIQKSLNDKDPQLLSHLLDNIAENITDGGYIDISLPLLKDIMSYFQNDQSFETFEGMDFSLTERIGSILATAKNYFPVEVDRFIKQDLEDINFPGISKYKKEILEYNPGTETLADLLTHKFGNYVMWSLINEKVFSDFSTRVIRVAIEEKDCFSWFDRTMKIVFQELFKVNFRHI